MRIPFDLMPASELMGHFQSAGFSNVQVGQQQQDLVFDSGVAHAVEAAYATPIGPKLKALPEKRQAQFQNTLRELLVVLSHDGITMGRMVTNVLSAEKAS